MQLSLYTVSKKEGKLEVLYADDVEGLYRGIVDVVGMLKPGDRVATPYGDWWMLSPWKPGRKN